MACCVCRGDLSSGLAKTKKLHGLACKESRRVLEEEVSETLGLGLHLEAAQPGKPSPNVSYTSSSITRLDSLQARPCNFFVLASPEDKSPLHTQQAIRFASRCNMLQQTDNAKALWLSYCPRIQLACIPSPPDFRWPQNKLLYVTNLTRPFRSLPWRGKGSGYARLCQTLSPVL